MQAPFERAENVMSIQARKDIYVLYVIKIFSLYVRGL